MPLDDNITASGSYNIGLIKPIDSVNKQPQYKEQRERQSQKKEPGDEVILSKEAQQAMDNIEDSAASDREPHSNDISDDYQQIDIHV